MIATVTMNPCFDKTFTINGFAYGGLNRVQEKRTDYSGKGINVSIVLQQLGVPVRTFGINYSQNGNVFSEGLAGAGIRYEAFMVQGRVRENIKVRNAEDRVTTELNQKGDPLTEDQLQAFTARLLEQLSDPSIDLVVITGSVPQGVPATCYYDLTAACRKMGKRVILDAEGELLLEGLKAGPELIKPNLYEFITAFAPEDKSRAGIVRRCREIIDGGVKMICLSMGKEGAMLVNDTEAWYCAPSSLEVHSTQGAGDSMVAGMCMAMEQGLPLSEILRYGVIAANGSLVRDGTQLCTRENFDHFEKEVRVTRL
ncbi:MAG: 1-phosphofructokinase family hexose kinase [Bilifractor sp.]